MKRSYVISSGVVILLAAIFLSWYLLSGGNGRGVRYRTARLERGDMVQTVRATGTVQPMKLVQVGTQVNGPVSKLYVDYNDKVKKGDLVAQIDPIVYEARLAQDEANLLQNLAMVEEAQALLSLAEKELKRAQELAGRDMLSQSELDQEIVRRDTLVAKLKVAKAEVKQGEASLRLSEANLNYTSIRSPVDGVIIARNVDEGQTVVASLSAQVLFLIATDLKHLQVEASIPEADIGKIKVGQPVTFTVDAYEKEFYGNVFQIRLDAAIIQNVVTYPVVISAENPEGELLPSMTVNISCEVARKQDVLRVPNAALRFKPVTDTQPMRTVPTGEADEMKFSHKIWIQKQPGGQPVPVGVIAGITDGSYTEIQAGQQLEVGQEIIIGVAQKGSADKRIVNPFRPQRRRRR